MMFLFRPPCGAKSHQERSNWICETTRFWEASETCRGVAGIIYIYMGIKTSIDLTRVTVICSGGCVGAVMRGRRDAQISSHITESAVKNELSIHHIIIKN